MRKREKDLKIKNDNVSLKDGQRREERALPDYLPKGKDIFEAQALLRFIGHVATAQKTTAEDVYEQITTIWDEEGFIHPKQLEKKLFLKGVSEDTPEKAELFDKLIEMPHTKDEMTKFESEGSVPLSSALANLYAIHTIEIGKPVPVLFVEGDYGNMGGSNIYYFDEKVKLDLEASKNPNAGFKYTDAAARVLGGLAYDELNYLAEKAGGICIPERNGGDELRFILVGVDEEVVEQVIENEFNPKSNRFAADIASSTHPHLKYAGDDNKRGIALALGVARVGDDAEPVYKKVVKAEKGVKYHKAVSGAERSGVLAPEKIEKYQKHLHEKGMGGKGLAQKAEVETREIIEEEYTDLVARNEAAIANGGPIKILDDIMAGNHPEYGKYFANDADEQDISIEIDSGNRALLMSYTASVRAQVNATVPETDPDYEVFQVVADRFEVRDASGAKLKYMKQEIELSQKDSAEIAEKYGLENADSLLVEVRHGSLGMVNDGIGYQHADALLQTQKDFLEDSLRKHGMGSAADTLLHKKGGTFQMVIPAVLTNEDGEIQMDEENKKPLLVTDDNLKDAFDYAFKRVKKEINGANIPEFYDAISREREELYGKGEGRKFDVSKEYNHVCFGDMYNSKKDTYGVPVSGALVVLKQDNPPEMVQDEMIILGDIHEKAAVEAMKADKYSKLGNGVDNASKIAKDSMSVGVSVEVIRQMRAEITCA